MIMRRTLQYFFLGILILSAGFISAAHALNEKRAPDDVDWRKVEFPIVVELFTSTDCLACIFADSKLYSLSKQPKVITLSCHIDGFTGKSGYSERVGHLCANRQWLYHENSGIGSELYTPQMVLNGGYPFQAIGEEQTNNFIRSYYQMNSPHAVDMAYLDKDTITISIPNGTQSEAVYNPSYSIFLVRYQDSAVLKIVNEELGNEERVIRYTNIIQDMQHIGRWYAEPLTLQIDLNRFSEDARAEPGGWVILVQRYNGSGIVAAGVLEDPGKKKEEEQTQEPLNASE
jgi:hypothetical protein